MVRIILVGCNGRMGRMINDLVNEDDGCEIVAGIDVNDSIDNDYPVFAKCADCNVDADVVIDFGTASVVDGVVDYCVDKSVALVTCSTGLSEDTLSRIREASKTVAVLKSANMSLGINLLMKILKENASRLTEAGFDVEIVEKHHRTKLDAPSGTAIALADSVKEGTHDYDYVYDRTTRRAKRDANEIGISAVRGGTIVGEHDVIFAGSDEVVTFSHTAYSRMVFAKGAVSAAKYLFDKPAGYYDMSDVLK